MEENPVKIRQRRLVGNLIGKRSHGKLTHGRRTHGEGTHEVGTALPQQHTCLQWMQRNQSVANNWGSAPRGRLHISQLRGWPMRLVRAALVAMAAGTLLLPASRVWACYGVIVGREVSADGSVLFGHNEQNGNPQYPSLRRIPPLEHPAGTQVRLKAGGQLPQAPETLGFLWSELPGMEFSDAYLNEKGVAVGSDGCPSRETRRDLTDGGIGYMLRRLVAQQARTAREGVHIAGRLVEQFGYNSSGRTLVIADPREAWIMCLVQGRHWVARRVPDDGVVLLPNVYIIGQVDLADTTKFLGSPDLVEYAVERGWYDPASGASFSFRAAYQRASGVDPRQRSGQALVLGTPPPPEEDGFLPFAVFPQQPLDVADVASILRTHSSPVSICHDDTQEGAVFQLRDGVPPAVGCVYWRSAAEPCTGLMVPWYAGILSVPAEWYHAVPVSQVLQVSHHFSSQAKVAGAAWSVCKGLQDAVNQNRPQRLERLQQVQQEFEQALFHEQRSLESRALALHASDSSAARELLTAYSADAAARALSLAALATEALQLGEAMPTTIPGEAAEDAPATGAIPETKLNEAIPNPFNEQVLLSYELAAGGPVQLTVCNILGQTVSVLDSGYRPAGHRTAVWDGRDQARQPAATGHYLLQLRHGGTVSQRRVLLLR